MEEVERVICGSSDDFTNILSLRIYKIERYYLHYKKIQIFSYLFFWYLFFFLFVVIWYMMFFENCCFLSSVVFWNLMFVSFVIIFWNMLFSKIWNLLLFNSVVFSDLLLLGSTLICCHQVVVAYILKYFKSRHSIKSRSCLFFKYFKSRLFSFAGGSPPCTPRRSAGGRPIGQEIMQNQNTSKCRGLW